MEINSWDEFALLGSKNNASLRGLSVPPQRAPTEGESSQIDYGAGAKMLHKYQSEWSEMHRTSELNAVTAQEVDILIRSLDRKIGKQFVTAGQLALALANIPQLLAGVQGLMEDIGQFQQIVEEVEKGLVRLENLVEVQELQEKQLDHRFQLAMYKEKKLGELERLRVSLVSTHSAKLAQHEQKEKRVLKERQETFGEAFKQDLQRYQECGAVPKLDEVGRNLSLDEVTIEPEDSTDLDRFLREESTVEES